MEQLRKHLQPLEGKGYKAYKDIQGCYHFPGFQLCIDHVQGDPFAAPSRISVRMSLSESGIPIGLWLNRDNTIVRRIALEDYLGRYWKYNIARFTKGRRGSGCSGEFNISTSGQQVLARNAVVLGDDFVEVRLTACLPANSRRVAAKQAIEMFFTELPKLVEQDLFYKNLPHDTLQNHLDSIEDQHVLRSRLREKGLVAFIADGSILPRASGIDDQPLKDALVWQSPANLTVSINTPNAGTVHGLGIPPGVTLIVGGGFHGKSTLLHALERGAFNHIPSDGREKVVSLENAVKIRAEDGRAISRVNISPFIDRLPFARDTHAFSTENASGSTSQAANIIEALETGTELLLIDEDTSASNFMIRDARMQALVHHDKEPITPLITRVRELYTQHGVSSIIVMGGSGDYFSVADTVIMMDTYQAKNVTDTAKALADPAITDSGNEGLPGFTRHCQRKPNDEVLDASWGKKAVKIDSKSTRLLLYGSHRIDLALVEQLIDIGQTRSIGLMIQYYRSHYATLNEPLITGLKRVLQDIEEKGLDCISPYKVGNLAIPRVHELAAAINRIREGQWHTLRME